MTAVRTCVGCGKRAPQTELLRVAQAGGVMLADLARRQPGRGAWLHRRAECWSAFAARRGSVRSLRMAPARAAREALRDQLTRAFPGA